LQRVAGAFPAHIMMRQPVQFGLHKRNQLFERSLVSAAPVAQQLGDLLSRGWGRRHTGCSTLQILPRSGDFYSLTAFLSISRSRGGFQAAFPLYHMNRHHNDAPEKTKTENKP
jgi:hypothetical protein